MIKKLLKYSTEQMFGYERSKLMNKEELTSILDKLSDDKLDLFISFLREISGSELPRQSSLQAEPKAN